MAHAALQGRLTCSSHAPWCGLHTSRRWVNSVPALVHKSSYSPHKQSARRWRRTRQAGPTASVQDAVHAVVAEKSQHLKVLGRELELPQGRLAVRLLSEEDVKAATVVITRAFVSTGYFPLEDAGQYCKAMLGQPPNGVLIVARLFPKDTSLLPEGQESRLIGTVALSFTRDTREEFPTLQPPDEGAYLSNMAVDPSFRRQGMARLLLAACEELCAARGFKHIYLHARLGDEPAIQLYESSGYKTVQADSILVKLRGIMPRMLMSKDVPPGLLHL